MPVVSLRLLSDGVQLLVEVHDQAPGRPLLLDAGRDAEGGRGLAIVNALAAEWGWHTAPNGIEAELSVRLSRLAAPGAVRSLVPHAVRAGDPPGFLRGVREHHAKQELEAPLADVSLVANRVTSRPAASKSRPANVMPP